MDRYTRTILTIIALLLGVITFQLTQKPVKVSIWDSTPTYGDYRDAREKKDAMDKFRLSLPVVYVYGGSIEIDNGSPRPRRRR